MADKTYHLQIKVEQHKHHTLMSKPSNSGYIFGRTLNKVVCLYFNSNV